MKRETLNVVVAAGCREYGGPRPNYKIGESGVMVLCKACPAYLELQNSGARTSGATGQKNREKGVVMGLPENLPETLTVTAKRIYLKMKQRRNCTYDSLAKDVGVTRETVRVSIASLVKHGLIRRVGPDKGGHWEVVDGQ